MSQRKRPSTLKKKPSEKPIVASTPAFQSRRTLADHVKDNMACAGRRNYYQRIIYIIYLKENTTNIAKEMYNTLVTEVNKYSTDDQLTGFMLNYTAYSVHMIEGSEEIVGNFIQKLLDRLLPIFLKSKVVLIYNNANQKFFRRMIVRFAEPPILIDKIQGSNVDLIQYQVNLLIKKVYSLCQRLQTENIEDKNKFRVSFLTRSYNKILPEIILLDYILDLKALPSIEEYGNINGEIPDLCLYDERVWPIPFDFTPNNVFDWGKYDINLTFGNKKK